MVTRNPKYMPEDGSAPKNGLYACRTCKQWVASGTGKTGHLKKNPDHVMYSLLTGQDVGRYKNARRPSNPVPPQVLAPTNGHRAVTTVLLQSAFAKLREEVTAELDRLESQLFPATQNLKPITSRRTYVAR